ncbi:hypothetical protein [Sunxiuqinia rutila]|uniref:hypothetical protein n=1 Tax=Sunxiuqinia rutila TaxID=1397841 RepID=UPI003D36A9A0
MNQEQNKHMRMFLNTQNTLDQNTAKWNMIPIMLSSKNELDELIQRMEETNEKTDPKSSGVTSQKENVRLGLTDKVMMISGILQAYAAFNNDPALAHSMELFKSDLLKCREADVESKVAPIIDKARELLTELADFMLTEEMLLETETSLDSFKALIGMPRTIRNRAFAAKSELQDLVDETNALLKNKIDKLMLRFEMTDPTFCDEYNRARVIVD